MRTAALRQALLALAVAASPAAAVDLEALSRQDKRIHCVAYGLIDLQYRYDNGMIDEAAYQRQRMQLGWRIQDRGDNFNYAGDFRKLDAAIDRIIAERPSVAALSEQAAYCRSYLRL